MNIGFDSIQPTASYPVGITAASLAVNDWTSRAKAVMEFKGELKNHLRKTQKARCCFCRRLLPDPAITDLEHFIEKAVAPWLAFEILNIALSCRTCNTRKNAAFARLSGRLTRIASKAAGYSVEIKRSPALTGTLASPTPLPTTSSSYRWIHPHFDKFSHHLTLKKGWVFSSLSKKGQRTKEGLKLNQLSSLEQRAMVERIASRDGSMSMLLAGFSELNNQDWRSVCRATAESLRLRKGIV